MGGPPDLSSLTRNEHLALALVLWKSYYNTKHTNGVVPSNLTCDAADRVLAMARELGVLPEFMAIMKRFPVMRVEVRQELMTVKELEEWDD